MLDEISETQQPYVASTIRVPVRRVNPVVTWDLLCNECDRLRSPQGAREVLIGNMDVIVCRSCWEAMAT